MLKNTGWFFFAFFAIAIGLYPLSYYFFNMSKGLFSSKPSELLLNIVWKSFFYTHISFGGVALLTGWSQFSKKLRDRKLLLHRRIGKVYVSSVILSGVAGLYVACFSTGGLITHFGFGILAFLWLLTTVKAFITIRQGNINAHQNWMIRSYALCFAAVTLRLWIPVFQIIFQMEFNPAYQVISWLCWVPNLMVAELIIRNKNNAMPVTDAAII